MKTSVPWWRWILNLLLGYLLWEIGNFLGKITAIAVAGEASAVWGNFWALTVWSLVQVVIIVWGMRYVWKIVDGDYSSIGLLVGDEWKPDLLYGTAVGLSLALIQYLVILPLTGGAQRSDVIATAEIMGTDLSGLIAAIIFGWLAGGISEEIFYRGHLIRSLTSLLGGKSWALWTAIIISIGYFAIGHAFQGWSGLLNAGSIAIVYTSLFLWRRRLLPGIVAHGVYNTLAFLGIYFLLM